MSDVLPGDVTVNSTHPDYDENLDAWQRIRDVLAGDSGFDKTSQLRIGSTTAWVTNTLGATAGYLEFKADGLATFERLMDRVERLLSVLGSRLLESQRRVSDEALAIRQGGESSIILANERGMVGLPLRKLFFSLPA